MPRLCWSHRRIFCLEGAWWGTRTQPVWKLRSMPTLANHDCMRLAFFLTLTCEDALVPCACFQNSCWNQNLTVGSWRWHWVTIKSAGLPACLIGRCCACFVLGCTLCSFFSSDAFLLRLKQGPPCFCLNLIPTRYCAWVLSTFICASFKAQEGYRVTLWTPHYYYYCCCCCYTTRPTLRLSHTASIYTQQAFTHSKVTASKHLHTAGFHSQQAFTQRSFYKQKLSHTGSLYAVKPKAHTRYLLRHSLRPMNKEASGYGRRACRRQLNRMLVCKRKKDTYMQI